MVYQLLRNATAILHVSNKKFLIDPMLGERSSNPPMPWSTNDRRNPLVDLPLSKSELKEIIRQVDAVIVTHLHPDHWDQEAIDLIPKGKLIICQPQDAETFVQQGFYRLNHLREIKMEQIHIRRVNAIHGHGELESKMAPASGFILSTNDIVIYIAGDTVWHPTVLTNLRKYKPDVIVLNGGAAQFTFGEPITMTFEDIDNVLHNSDSTTTVVVVHLEAINHCLMTRKELKMRFREEIKSGRLHVPDDGIPLVIKEVKLFG